MTIFERVQGDINDTVVVNLYGVATFASATVVAHVWASWPPHGAPVTNLTAAVVDGVDSEGVACGVCTVQLGNASGWLATLAAAGDYNLECDVTFVGGQKITWPGTGKDMIRVTAQGA